MNGMRKSKHEVAEPSPEKRIAVIYPCPLAGDPNEQVLVVVTGSVREAFSQQVFARLKKEYGYSDATALGAHLIEL